MLDAAAVSLALPNPLERDGWTPESLAWLVGLHDVGKADPAFQHQEWESVAVLEQRVAATRSGDTRRLRARLAAAKASLEIQATDLIAYPNEARFRHERFSARFVRERLKEAAADDLFAMAVARAVVAHHGYWYEGSRPSPAEYAEAQKKLSDQIRQLLGNPTWQTTPPADTSAFGMRLAGHIVLCDWIASNEEYFKDPRLRRIEDAARYFEQSKVVAAEWVGKLGLKRDESEGRAHDVVASPRPLQEALLDAEIPPALVVIEAPMGEGKTEAAWILAERWRSEGYCGLYMALPTMATSESLHARYRDDYLVKLGRAGDAKLVHGMAWLRDDLEPEKLPETGELGDDSSLAAAWFRPTRRAMLAAHGVGTVDQAMLAGMHVKFGFLRLCGLDRRVLVIDEVHAYDAYMTAIIGRLLTWCSCLRIPVILLSATLSARQRAGLLAAYGATHGDPEPDAAYPLITIAEPGRAVRTVSRYTDGNGNQKDIVASMQRTLTVIPHTALGDAKKTAQLAEDLTEGGGCCCVILNTVKQAQAVYQEVKLPCYQKRLFHSRFTAADRETITNRVLNLFGKGQWIDENGERTFKPPERPEKFILVATQVAEQSLDVDFDHMISEIAPIDLLLQRSGRIKRHARTKDGGLKEAGVDERGEPELHVLVPKDVQSKPPRFGSFENTVYHRYPLLRTLDIVKKGREVQLPDEFRLLIEAVYAGVPGERASDDLTKAKEAWDDLQDDLAAQAGAFLLCEPMGDEFEPVSTDEVGDDSDDGNGWRARTRLGLEDVLIIPITNGNVQELAKGELDRHEVKALCRTSVKLPAWHWPIEPVRSLSAEERKKRAPVLGERKLKGVWLLPIDGSPEQWSWSGRRRVRSKDRIEWKPITFTYDQTTGLAEVEKAS